MDLTSAAAQNLMSPVLLFFLLGIFAGLLKSGLTIPETLSAILPLVAYGLVRAGTRLDQALGASVVAIQWRRAGDAFLCDRAARAGPRTVDRTGRRLARCLG
jgi:hypothetical protein